jgi:hypothetical protein
MLSIDHVIIAVNDLDTASETFRTAGFTVLPGGTHASGATHNALIVFHDGTYLELMALTGEPAKPVTADYSFLFAHGEGVVGLCLSSDGLEADVAAIRTRGISISELTEGGRLRPDGVEMRWLTAWVEGEPLPFLIEDVTPRVLRVTDIPAYTTHANGAAGIRGMSIETGANEISARFDAVFGLPEVVTGSRLYTCGTALMRLETRYGIERAIVHDVWLTGLNMSIVAHGTSLVAG